MCGELWSGRGEQEGRMLGEGRGGEFQEGERWGVTRSLITYFKRSKHYTITVSITCNPEALTHT